MDDLGAEKLDLFSIFFYDAVEEIDIIDRVWVF